MSKEQRYRSRSVAAMVDKVQVDHLVAFGNVHCEHVIGSIKPCLHFPPVIGILPVIHKVVHDRAGSTVCPFFSCWLLDIRDDMGTLDALSYPVKGFCDKVDFEWCGLSCIGHCGIFEMV